MARKATRIFEGSKIGQFNKEQGLYQKNPPITRLTPEQADGSRKLTFVGSEAVKCDLLCHGSYIGERYNRTANDVNATKRGLKVEGFENIPYLAVTCRLTENKICVTPDRKLRAAAEKVKI